MRRPLHYLELGRRGERRAAWFYRLRGYRIVARNVRSRGGELDLIVRRGRLYVFVEVKSRQSKTAGEGYEAVGPRKRERIIALAGHYAGEHHLTGISIRYDILSLYWNGRRFEVTHLADAFRPMADTRRPWLLRA